MVCLPSPLLQTVSFLLENLLEKKAEVRFQPLLCVLAAALGIVCVILLSVIIILSNRRKSATSGAPNRRKKRGESNCVRCFFCSSQSAQSNQNGKERPRTLRQSFCCWRGRRRSSPEREIASTGPSESSSSTTPFWSACTAHRKARTSHTHLLTMV